MGVCRVVRKNAEKKRRQKEEPLKQKETPRSRTERSRYKKSGKMEEIEEGEKKKKRKKEEKKKAKKEWKRIPVVSLKARVVVWMIYAPEMRHKCVSCSSIKSPIDPGIMILPRAEDQPSVLDYREDLKCRSQKSRSLQL